MRRLSAFVNLTNIGFYFTFGRVLILLIMIITQLLILIIKLSTSRNIQVTLNLLLARISPC
jgi:hypothetical protein